MPNGIGAYEYEEAAYDEAAYDEGVYDESVDGESLDGEAAFKPRRVATARPVPLPPRPAGRGVTQAQLQMAVNRLNGDIRRNSTAIQRVNTNLTALGKDVRRQRAGVRDTRKDIGQLRDALILMPLLQGAMGRSNPMLSALFPMMMLGGIGTEGQAQQGGGGLLGGDQMTTMMLVLALSDGFGGGS